VAVVAGGRRALGPAGSTTSNKAILFRLNDVDKKPNRELVKIAASTDPAFSEPMAKNRRIQGNTGWSGKKTWRRRVGCLSAGVFRRACWANSTSPVMLKQLRSQYGWPGLTIRHN